MNFEPEFKKRFADLNDKQKEAVEEIYGPVLVVAGPGSGKTELLSLRVANILQKTDTLPSSILCLTYTDAAAINMRQRLAGLIGREAYRVAIHTFHNFGVEIINRHPEFFYNAATFSPADELMQSEILTGIFNDLSYKNPLKNEHPERGYAYLYHVQRAIGYLKKAGITPDEFLNITKHNAKELEKLNERANQIFGDRVSDKVFDQIALFVLELKKYKPENKFPVDHFEPICNAICGSLENVLLEAEADDWSTRPVSEWKKEWLQKIDYTTHVFKDFNYIEKMLSLAGIYKEYTQRMYKLGYFDFDDMLIDTIQEMQKNNSLRYNLQEQYQFILVDEFQDTNDAQLRLLELICDSDANEGKPNIMAVGDDDQAIYKFQGAELSNILKFKIKYKAQIINLIHNYRSTQEILDFAKNIIRKGKERLENKFKEINKDLIAVGDKKSGEIVFRNFDTNSHEFYWVAKEVKKLIDDGTPADEIAVISRQHKMLEGIVPFFHELGIPVYYERQRNVLKEPHISQIIQISKFISSLSDKNDSANELLPEILSYPFWGLGRLDLWKLSLIAVKNDKTWLEIMLESSSPKLVSTAKFLIELASKAKHEPLEQILDLIIGSQSQLLSDSQYDDGHDNKTKTASFISPFKEYYFGKEKLKNDLPEYMFFLSGLSTFYSALREYKHGESVKIADLIEFVNSHEENNMPLTDMSPFVNSKKAVQLMTAHKSKGSEFDTVFVLSCQEDIWAKSFFNSFLPLPHNLPISPAGDGIDDKLRLFYVALTRSKRNLYLTSYENNENGRESLKLNFVVDQLTQRPEKFSLNETGNALSVSISNFNKPPFYKNEKVLLEERIKDYQMSVTHLNNFLNVLEGGPQVFFEQNLLRFPQAKSPSGAFGSAIHKSIELIYISFKKENKLPELEQALQWFEKYLRNERLNNVEISKYLDKGKDALTNYFENNKDKFNTSDLIEQGFKNQGVCVGDALLNGKIDKMVETAPGELRVHDLKTGSVPQDWNGKTVYEKIKLHNYKRQLAFYKLLVENSRDFGKYKVKEGVLEFVEATENDPREMSFIITPVFMARTEKLIQAVYKKIKNLDFPDVSNYSPNLDGVMNFEDDLLRET